MTVIVGITYQGGIVMGSDLVTRVDDMPHEKNKIKYSSHRMWAFTGTYSKQATELFDEYVQNHSKKKVSLKRLERFFILMNKTLQKSLPEHRVEGMVADVYGEPQLCEYSQTTGLKLVRSFYCKNPVLPVCLDALFNESQAIEAAINTVRTVNNTIPNYCSGIEVFTLTKEGAHRKYYEPAVLNS